VTLSPEGQFAGYLSTLDQRLQRIADTGVAEVCLQPFSPEFAAMPAVEFLDDILGVRLNAHLVVVGKDYRFGQGGEGDIHLLRSWGEQHQCEIIVVPEVRLHGDKVSSSRIRRLIAEGDTRLAESCLGFPFAMTGTVIEGKKLGRKLGFPTANIAIDADLAIPAYGVYATRTRVGNRTYESITNIGIRPTIQDESPKPNIESFLFDTSLDLYGQAITVEFLYRLRPEAVFESLLDLVAQVKEDLAQARAYHRSCEQGYEFANVRGIPVRIIRTTRFAQATAIITYRTRIDRRTASLLSLLSRVLSASCQDYPSRSSLTAALDSLYGASIETEVSKDGDLFSLHIAVNGLMNWTDRSSPFAAALGVFFSLLTRPDLDADGLFQAVSFEAERSGLVMELLAGKMTKPNMPMTSA
jgi:riboflavin kinase/FMN adenylyltransferase